MDVPEGSQRLSNRQKGNDTRLNELIKGDKKGISEQAQNWLKGNKSKIMDQMDEEYHDQRAIVRRAEAIKMRDYERALGSAQRDSRGLPISGYGTQFRRGGPERARLRDEVKRGMMKGLTEEQALRNIYEGKVNYAMTQYANRARADIPDLVTSEYNTVVAADERAKAVEGARAMGDFLKERAGQVQHHGVSGVDISQGVLNSPRSEGEGGGKKKTKKRKMNRKKAKAKTNKRKKHGRKSKTHKKRRYGRKSRRH